MNTNNYASLEASKRLVDAGIVLETDFYWTEVTRGTGKLEKNCFAPGGYCEGLQQVWEAVYKPNGVIGENIWSAPSMAEVWRELPERTSIRKTELCACVWIENGGPKWDMINTNPTDALIDLLIWVTEQKRKEEA